MFMIPMIVITAVIGYWIHIFSKSARKKMDVKFNTYLKREMQANVARKKEIDPAFFFVPDTSSLPFRDHAENERPLTRRQNAVKKKSQQKMLRFDKKYSNTELKLRYGIANLESIILYEANGNAYIYALVEWGQALLDSPYHDDAEVVLQESIRLGSNYSKSYLLLISFYKQKNDRKKIMALRDIVNKQFVFGDSITKSKILNAIDDALESMRD